MRKENLEYFYKIRIFRLIASKHVILSNFSIFSVCSQILRWKKFKRPEKKFCWGGPIFLIRYMHVSTKINDSIHFWLILSVYESFNGHGTFSLIFWLFINSPLKKFGRPKKSFYEVDLFFLNRYTSELTKKNDWSHLWLIFSVYEFLNGYGIFFQNFPGRKQNFQ